VHVLVDGVATVAIGRFNQIVGQGLKALIAEDPRLRVVASNLDADELEAALGDGVAQVAIVSRIAERSAWERLRHASPNAGIVVVGPVTVLAYGMALFAAQVTCVAWSLDELGAGALCSVVWRTACGETLLVWCDGRVLARRMRSEPPLLTGRELEVLAHVGEKLKYAEIGFRLGIAPETVRTHVARICSKLNLASSRELCLSRQWGDRKEIL
jgi:DNA-binding NarL/FixJ family response regulator